MRYLFIISILSNILFSNSIDLKNNIKHIIKPKINNQKIEDKYKVVPKSKKDMFSKSNLEVTGSIRLKYGF